MKNIIFSILVFLSISAFGQKISILNKINAKRYVDKGLQEYYNGRTSSSYMTFKEAITLDSTNHEAYQLLANTELDLHYYYAALEHIKTAYTLAKKKSDPDLNYIKAQAHHRLGDVENALAHYKVAFMGFSKSINQDYDLGTKIAQCEFAINENTKGLKNIRKPLAEELTTKHDEYGPILCLNGKHIFYTARKPETMGNNMNPDDQKFFEDIYHAVFNEESKMYELEIESTEEANTEGFDALSYVSEDGMAMFGTLNTSASRETMTSSSDIVEYSSGEPGIITSPSVINNKNINTSYFEGSPTISDTTIDSDEVTYQTMIFVSDRNAEKKMTDLYQVEFIDEVWQEPTPLPDFINTTSRETTPFISPDGMYLFFSSDGLPGFGGYDIYYSKKEHGVWTSPKNLGPQFNTVNDDTHFQIYSWGVAVAASVAEVDGSFNYQLFQFEIKDLDLPFLK